LDIDCGLRLDEVVGIEAINIREVAWQFGAIDAGQGLDDNAK
jgi:hypothetical protein